MKKILPALCTSGLLSVSPVHAATYEADVIVYGGTSAAVIAAVQVKKMGRTVIVVSPDERLGGLSAGGLGATDFGDKSVIGGLSRNFYHRIFEYYQNEEIWKWEDQEEFGKRGRGDPKTDKGETTLWVFEPRAAKSIFEDYIRDFDIPVHRKAFLNREDGVKMTNGKIDSITTLAGDTFRGKVFLDTTYEGDLMAAAGVSYTVGREGMDQYGESYAGVQTGVFHHPHNFSKLEVDPYVVPGDPSSGVLPLISTEAPGEKGSADKRVQAYNFRICMTNVEENRIPFPKPPDYDEERYELLGRVYDAGWTSTFGKFDRIPNHKTDTNNHGPVSTDYIGANYDYPEASYEERREIVEDHKNYTLGLLYYTANSERVPEEIRERMNTWGLAKDEYEESDNWTPHLYIREARRMLGKYVMTQNELTKKTSTPESVGMGSYTIDSHNTQRYITEDGEVENEGDIGVDIEPYEIAYGSLVPRKSECSNLLVTCAVSASHVAYGSIRMEPVFMILGQSAATAAVLALDKNLAVQDVPHNDLEAKLLEDKQILTFKGRIQ
ncbi:FAD-dependent oxidoreductase [Puniceicoccus vermicola]|uniref:FAD-dependent oxidoreductase n=1 Tax=Puniceicoccus vermicola TaxID=388746 RepID=A0A7X1AZM5_9BACT|nr:FAD-dependent oxidoreductase [Puniceicoccus vermicola]MBC2602921.1 FAD-dependent oxidoreductase [Puniceicoccus vermicola]